MLTLPITKQQQLQEWNTIQTIARKNGFPNPIIQRLKTKIENKIHKQQKQNRKTLTTSNTEQKEKKKKWVIFKYHSPLIRKVTNLFKQTELKIALRTTNTISQKQIKNITYAIPVVYIN
jgi:23S rRNA maturation mini-RNase III